MSKWSLVESKKKYLVSLPFILILLVSFVSVIILLPINNSHTATAANPAFLSAGVDTSCTTCTSYTITGWPNPSTMTGDKLLLEQDCQTSAASITSITDTVGDVWLAINKGLSLTGGTSFITEMWYTTVISTNSVTNTITINIASTATICTGIGFYSNTPLISLAANAVPQPSGQTVTSSIFGVVPPLNISLLSTPYVLNTNDQYVTMTSAMTAGFSAPHQTVITSDPRLSDFSPQSCGNLTCKQSTQTFTPSISNVQYFSNFAQNAGQGIAGTYNYMLLTAIFDTSTTTPPNCTNCSITGGGITKDKTTTFTPSMPNETLLYIMDAPVGGASLTNITTEAASYTNAGAGKSIDFIYLCIYQLTPPGTLQEAFPITSANQLKQTNCVLNHAISTGQTNQMIHWYPSITIPASTTFAIAVFSRFAGLSLYATKDTITLNGDTADYTGTSGTPPQFLSNFFTVTPSIWFNFIGSQTAILVTGTVTTTTTICTVGATCTVTTTLPTTTVTSISTSLIYTLSGTNGAVANIQDFTLFLPVWILPLVMGGLFGIIGFLFGAILGLGMGSVLGVIPLWMSFLLGLGILLILIRKGGF